MGRVTDEREGKSDTRLRYSGRTDAAGGTSSLKDGSAHIVKEVLEGMDVKFETKYRCE